MKGKQKNKKIIYGIIGIVALILVTIGITYAYWLVTKTQNERNVVTAKCFDISLNNEVNDITLSNQFPMSDEDGMELVPYEFTVTNNCNTSLDYQIALEAIETGDEIESDSIKVVLNDNAPRKLYDYVGADTTIEGAYEAYILGYGTLAASGSEGSSATYELRLWIDADAPISEMNKTFTSKISVSVGQGISAQGDTLASLILEDAEANGCLYSTTPDFDTVTFDGEYGLYSTQDDYGTSYYFRGDVDNNYVEFGTYAEDTTLTVYDYSSYTEKTVEVKAGDPMYWRIVRINGDGSVRLIYDGTELVANGVAHTATIGATAYNTNYDNAKYVGYTYDDGTGTQVDSKIKGVVDAWYDKHLETTYGTYIEDSIFCNDRQDDNADNFFAPYDRLGTNKTPSVKCTNKSDRYTTSEETGNGLLSNPVGLITADEVAFAGGVQGYSNSNYYLYSYEMYWTSAPYAFGGVGAFVWGVGTVGLLLNNNVDISNPGARPVINLKADTLIEGKGTIDNPYKIVPQ